MLIAWSRGDQTASISSCRSSTAYVRAVQGDPAPARRLLAEAAAEARSGDVGPALLYTILGDKEHALQSLEAACDQRVAGIVYLKVDPRFAPLRDEPRFKALITRMRL